MFLVLLNEVSLLAISYQNRQQIMKRASLSSALTIMLLVITILFIANVFYIVAESNKTFADDSDHDVQHRYTLVTDYLTLASTIAIDMQFLLIYLFFRSSRAVYMTIGLLLLEILIASLSFLVGTDLWIDLSNLSIAYATFFLSLLLHTGRLVIHDQSSMQFYDYYEMLAIEEIPSYSNTDSLIC